jgi:hypothetical protein
MPTILPQDGHKGRFFRQGIGAEIGLKIPRKIGKCGFFKPCAMRSQNLGVAVARPTAFKVGR